MNSPTWQNGWSRPARRNGTHEATRVPKVRADAETSPVGLPISSGTEPGRDGLDPALPEVPLAQVAKEGPKGATAIVNHTEALVTAYVIGLSIGLAGGYVGGFVDGWAAHRFGSWFARAVRRAWTWR